jgi:hypothetical protein
MPASRHRRRKTPSQRSALRLLAECGPAGCSANVIMQRGFCAADMIALIREGLASPNAERRGDMSCTYDLSRVTITAAGIAALTGANFPSHTITRDG